MGQEKWKFFYPEKKDLHFDTKIHTKKATAIISGDHVTVFDGGDKAAEWFTGIFKSKNFEPIINSRYLWEIGALRFQSKKIYSRRNDYE